MSNQTGIIGDNATVYDGIHFHNHAAAPPPIPNHLPSLEPCFLHREEELVWLNDRLHPGKVAAVCGPGGMGKSALAAQAVHQLDDARFPDGIVFHTFYGHPTTEEALQEICKAFGQEPEPPLDTTLRRVLSGRKALLILDGAEQADDLKAVLRLCSTCGVLITSRRNEDALDAPWELKPLEDEEAEAVLLRYSGPVDDMASAQAICALLKGWPVALRIAGRYLRNKKESAATYLRWLEKKPFKMLGSGTHQEDNMALLLERSVAQVSADAVQALRLTGVLAFAPIGLGPVMAVLYKEGEEQDELELRSSYALGELVSFGLMEKGVKCWQINHALFHTYARQELPLSKDTLERLVGAYVSFCRTQSEAGVKGYARLDAERAHCLRLMDSCLASELWNEVQYMENAIDSYLHRQGYWADQLTALGRRLTAAQQAGNRKGEAWCLNSLGQTYDHYREHQKALSCYEQSLKIYRALGDRVGESATLHNIATTYQQQGKYELALEHSQQSLSIRYEIVDRKGEGATLNTIGQLYYNQGDYEQALLYYEQGLILTRGVAEREGEGTIMNNIAEIYRAQGNSAKALEYHQQALAILQEIGDKAGEARSYRNIGLTYYYLGDLAKAEEHISQAVQIAEKMGHPLLEEWCKTLALVRAARRV